MFYCILVIHNLVNHLTVVRNPFLTFVNIGMWCIYCNARLWFSADTGFIHVFITVDIYYPGLGSPTFSVTLSGTGTRQGVFSWPKEVNRRHFLVWQRDARRIEETLSYLCSCESKHRNLQLPGAMFSSGEEN